METEDFHELTRRLTESDYFSLFQEVGSQLEMLDVKLNQSFVQEARTLANGLPKASQQFIEIYFRRYFLDGLKAMIRAFGTEGSPEEVQGLLVGTEEEVRELQELATAESLSLLIEHLTDQDLRSVLSEQIELAKSSNTTVPLELAIDRLFFRSLWKAIRHILKGADRDFAQRFVGNQIDLLNVQALLRVKRQFPDFDDRTIRDLLIPVNYRLYDTLDRCISAPSPTEIFNHLLDTPYRDFARLARESFDETGNLGDLEMRGKGHLHYLASRMLLGQPFHIGAFLAYLLLKSTEIQNVRAIAVGKASHIDKARIRQYVLIP